MATDLLANLNAAQRDAVTHGDGPLLIVAGAGTGKTTVVTSRVAWLLTQGKATAEQVLALTFTDKAAGEMEERIDRLVPYGTVDLWVSTFHGFCQRILAAHAVEIGLPGNSRLLNTTQQWLLLREHFDRFKLQYYRPLGNPTKFIHALISHFARAKDEAVSAEDYLQFARGLSLNTDTDKFLQQILTPEERASLTKKEIRQLAKQELTKVTEVADAYHAYQQLLLESSAMDFGDLIAYTLKLFRERPKILARYRAQFRYVLVDEFQDTNWAQYELVKLLADPKRNITVVGDDDQCLPEGTRVATAAGEKRIEDVAVGDFVVSAVGKGYVTYLPVSRVFRSRRTVRFITLTTAGGRHLTVTDNHKLFCLVPAVDDGTFFYVYLMHRQGLGWRIGVTNDLATRLRLERSADSIIGVRACTSDQEARFYETLYSLRYRIPTVCFQARPGVAIEGKWLHQLYAEIDTEANVRQMAKELNIDLSGRHAVLGAVNRGGKLRIKVNLEMCSRRYASRHSRGGFLDHPQILHQLSVETSDRSVLCRLREAGFRLTKARAGGWRLRVTGQDISHLGRVASRIAAISGGIIEASFKAEKTYRHTKKSLVMPAKNILVGHSVPVMTERGIFYDRVVRRTDHRPRLATVYDLEVPPAHNFIADGVVVHNSIYKFRGASVANILQFKDDFPNAREIFLTTNYRSRQGILDASYKFIQLNNPERLEAILARQSAHHAEGSPAALSKQLTAARSGESRIEHLASNDAESEAKLVAKCIRELKDKSPELTWSDFAILARANDHLNGFDYALHQAQIPYQVYASRGLYAKPVVLDVVSFLKLLDNYHESPAMYRVLCWPVFNLQQRDLVTLNYWAHRKSRSLYQTVHDAVSLPEVPPEVKETLQRVVALIDEHTRLTRDKGVREIIVAFLQASGYLQWLTRTDDPLLLEQVSYLNQFFRKVTEFETAAADRSVRAFLRQLTLELEAGEAGSLAQDPEQGPEAVKLMTVHAAKGLEFAHVFVVNMVERRFPTTERAETIPLPEGLIKERLPGGDVHLQEERRLFYVAVTRAKDGIAFTTALRYGGPRAKKLSQFLMEIGVEPAKLPAGIVPQLDLEPGESKKLPRGRREYYHMPSKFSYSQLKTYETCPWKYRFSFLLRVPVRGRAVFSFGQTMHSVLQRAYEQVMQQQRSNQGSLFDSAAVTPKPVGECLRLEEFHQWYQKHWIDDWYASQAEREKYFAHGKKLLADYYAFAKNLIVFPKYLEQGFTLKIVDAGAGRQYALYGKIDRVDDHNGKLALIDYKTGQAKTKLTPEDKEQLMIYQLAAAEIFQQPVESLTLHYLEGNVQQTFLGNEKDLARLKSKVITAIAEIERGEFVPSPGRVCKTCEFCDICEYRAA